MLRPLACLIVLASFTALPALAADDDVMTGYYGNTVVTTGGMAVTHWMYNADHSFAMTVPSAGMQFKGTWAVNGTNLCRTFDSPPPGATNPMCSPIEAHKVGDSWTVTSGDQSRTITLVQGVQ